MYSCFQWFNFVKPRMKCPFLNPNLPELVDNHRNGAGCLPLLELPRPKKDNPQETEQSWVLVLGLENDGRYEDTYNLFCGGRNYGENSYAVARRETEEESCGLVILPEHPNNNCIVGTTVDGTAIFAYEPPVPFTREDFLIHLEREIKGKNREGWTEMRQIEFFWIDKLKFQPRVPFGHSLETIDNKWVPVSSFAVLVLSTFFPHVSSPHQSL